MASDHRQKQTIQFHMAQNPKDTNYEKKKSSKGYWCWPLNCWRSEDTGMSERWSVALSLRLPFHLSLFKFPSSVATTSSSRTDRKLKHKNTQIMKTTVIKRHVCMHVYVCACLSVLCLCLCGHVWDRQRGGGGGEREKVYGHQPKTLHSKRSAQNSRQ